MPSPLDALAGLSSNAGDPNGLVQARIKKEQALREMQRSLELQAGDPHMVSGATRADIADEQDSLDESPNFGTEQQARVKGVQDTNAEMDTYNRPDVTKQRQDELAAKLAQATMPNVEMAKAQGANALALDAQRSKEEGAMRNDTLKAYLGMNGPGAPVGSQRTVHIGANGEPTISIAPPKPMGQLEQRAITSFHEAQPILDKLDSELGNPSSDALSQLLSKGKNMTTQMLYSQGLSTGNQTKQQLEGLLGVLGSSSYVVGSRSYQLIKQAMAHLTDANGSDAFNKQQLNEIRQLWPQMQEEVIAAHQTPERALNQGAPAPDPAGIR